MIILSVTQKTQQNTEFCCVRMFSEKEGNPNINPNVKNNVNPCKWDGEAEIN